MSTSSISAAGTLIEKRSAAAFKILCVLFAAGIVQTLYFSSIAIYLNSLGFSAFAISSSIAATALPHVFLGPRLGRLVDRSPHKPRLFLILNLAMAAALMALLAFTTLRNGEWVASVMMVVFATFLSPYQGLFTHYLLPSLDQNEDRIYAQWEGISAIACIGGGVLSYALLLHCSAISLISLTAFCYLCSGILIFKLWNFDALPGVKNAEIKNQNSALGASYFSYMKDRSVLLAVLGMWVFAFSIDALANNVQVIALKNFPWTGAKVALLGSAFSILHLAGAQLYRLLPEKWKADRLHLQTMLAGTFLIPLALCTLGMAQACPLYLLLGLISVGLLEPFWHINNTLLLRSRLPALAYGEVFARIRSPRAILTYVGTSLVGSAQDGFWLGRLCLVFLTIMLGLVILQIVQRAGEQR